MALLVAIAGPNCAKSTESQRGLLTTPTTTVSLTISGTVTDSAGAPISGAGVFGSSTVTGATQSATALTDDAGRFSIGPLDVDPSQGLFLVTSKIGYGTDSRKIVPTSPTVTTAIVLFIPAVPPVLSVDQTIHGVLSSLDPAEGPGDPFDSNYSVNTHEYAYRIPDGADCIVELEWDHVANANLRMWAQSNSIISRASGSKQTLVLPRGTSGTLLVGQPSVEGPLRQPVAYTLTTRSAQ